MAIALNTPIEEVKRVTQVQITGFRMNYENPEMVSEYMTLLEDGTPYQRGTASTTDLAEIELFMNQVEQLIIGGKDLDTASAEIAYGFVLSKLQG